MTTQLLEGGEGGVLTLAVNRPERRPARTVLEAGALCVAARRTAEAAHTFVEKRAPKFVNR